MKRILFYLTLFIALTSFIPGDDWREILRQSKNNRFYWGGNWTLTGTKNQWGNGMSFSSKTQIQLDAFNGSSDSLLFQLRRDDSSFAMKYSVFGPWRKFIMSNDTADMLSGYARTGNIISSITINTNNGITGSGTGSTFTLGLGAITPSSVSSSGAITGTTLAGTIVTGGQPNITSVGTLSTLSVTGIVTIGGITPSLSGKLTVKQSDSDKGIVVLGQTQKNGIYIYHDGFSGFIKTSHEGTGVYTPLGFAGGQYGTQFILDSASNRQVKFPGYSAGGILKTEAGTSIMQIATPGTDYVVPGGTSSFDSLSVNYAYNLPTTSSTIGAATQNRIGYNSTNGTYLFAKGGSVNDFSLLNAAGNNIFTLSSASGGLERISIGNGGGGSTGVSRLITNLDLIPGANASYDIGKSSYLGSQFKYRKGLFTDTLSTEGVLGGTLFTAAQPNITSVGTLTNITASGGSRLATTSGNVSIGTTSDGSVKLYIVDANPRIDMDNMTQRWGTLVDAGTGDWRLRDATNARNVILASNAGNVYNFNNTTTWNTTSDRRVKENIKPIAGALALNDALGPVEFDYKKEFSGRRKWKEVQRKGNYGFIAQEYEKVLPKYVTTSTDSVDGKLVTDFKGIDQSPIPAINTAAIKELHGIVLQQAAEIDALKKRLEALEKLLKK